MKIVICIDSCECPFSISGRADFASYVRHARDATISVFEGVLSMILGRLRCCLTACTKIMSRYWQYLFDIYINNEKFVLNALRSSMFRLRQYLKYAESSSTLDPWPMNRRSVGYHDGKNSLGGDPLQNFSLWGTAQIHHLMPFLEHYSTCHTRRHQRGRNNFLFLFLGGARHLWLFS